MAWTKASQTIYSGTQLINDVIWTGAKFVVVGSGGKIASSPDGVSWTQTGSSGFGTLSNAINGIAWSGSKFVAVGAGGKMAASPDGETWTLVTTSPLGANAINGIAWNASKFVAVGAYSGLAYSQDGETWTAVNMNNIVGSPILAIKGVVWDGGQFIAFGANKIARSTDGVTWTGVAVENLPSPFTSSVSLQDLAWNGTKLVAVGYLGTIIHSADNGASWTAVTDSPFGSININGIVWDGGKFISIGDSGKMAASTDGEVWTTLVDESEAIGATDKLLKIACGNGTYIISGQGFIAYSGAQE
jgi:hypothetical protein